MTTIIDYGAGNPASILNMLKRVGEDSVITSDPLAVKDAERLILPGVGSFDYGMSMLREKGLAEELSNKVLKEKTPVLGICLGLQLMALNSEEGSADGLGWIKVRVVRFRDTGLIIPHMGWNKITMRKKSRLFEDLQGDSRFYFVHSYFSECQDSDDILAVSVYGHEFTCAVEKDNILGVQFHPEKSHNFGMKVLKNFCQYY